MAEGRRLRIHRRSRTAASSVFVIVLPTSPSSSPRRRTMTTPPRRGADVMFNLVGLSDWTSETAEDEITRYGEILALFELTYTSIGLLTRMPVEVERSGSTWARRTQGRLGHLPERNESAARRVAAHRAGRNGVDRRSFSSGKSTLTAPSTASVHATDGTVTVDDEITGLSGRRLREARGHIGMIFQGLQPCRTHSTSSRTPSAASRTPPSRTRSAVKATASWRCARSWLECSRRSARRTPCRAAAAARGDCSRAPLHPHQHHQAVASLDPPTAQLR